MIRRDIKVFVSAGFHSRTPTRDLMSRLTETNPDLHRNFYTDEDMPMTYLDDLFYAERETSLMVKVFNINKREVQYPRWEVSNSDIQRVIEVIIPPE